MDNKSYKFFSFNSLIIIDAIPESDYQTARRLNDDLVHIIKPAGLQHIKIRDRLHFMEVMLDVIAETYHKRLSPILHFEGHGSEHDYILPNEEKVAWSVIADILRVINKMISNTLVTFIACCHGYNFIKSISILKFTPACYTIAPHRVIKGYEIEQEMSKFYSSLFESNDITVAKSTLNTDIMGFLDADELFITSVIKYFKQKTKGTGWTLRKESLTSEAIINIKSWDNLTDKEKKRNLKLIRASLKEMKSMGSRERVYDEYSMKFLGYIRPEAKQQVFKILSVQ
ncbi:hypothetical protein [Pantoea ananatis]|uniref:hypothetical protein n=1 Tax=Pantoea ananas TaxID=553 RepID=UPI001B30EF9C|nr:hypothetical protein [Pantoea ananatis]